MKLPRHAKIWLPAYLADRASKLLAWDSPPIRHVWVTIADHYEPFWNRADFATARQRVEAWRRRWPEIAAQTQTDPMDSPPRYTFFYPTEQYHPDVLDALAEMTHDGIADVEVHVHHDGEGRQDFIDRISTFCKILTERHGLLRRMDGHIRFGFIHGNWALDNSLPGGRWCGLNDEITILRDLGCYADLTMPAGACPSQARTINTLYWCTDDPQMPKSYDRGLPLRPGRERTGDLLMIPGPLGLRWAERVVPRMETGEVAVNDPPTSYRARRWLDLAPRIGEHVFLKLYTHGAKDSNLQALLSTGLSDLFAMVRDEAARRGAQAHFVSAWQMYLAADAISQSTNPLMAMHAANDPRVTAARP